MISGAESAERGSYFATSSITEDDELPWNLKESAPADRAHKPTPTGLPGMTPGPKYKGPSLLTGHLLKFSLARGKCPASLTGKQAVPARFAPRSLGDCRLMILVLIGLAFTSFARTEEMGVENGRNRVRGEVQV
jgi:hypothetical protein